MTTTTQQSFNLVCPVCQGTGWEYIGRDKQQYEYAKRCKCSTQAILLSKIKSAAIPDEFRDRNLNNYSKDNDNVNGWKKAYEFAKYWEPHRKGLLFYGPVGTGKTHLAVAIINNLMVSKEITALFVNTPDLLAELRQSQFRDGEDGIDSKLQKITECPLVCFDDLAKERMTDWVREQYYRIINYRYTHKLPVIITTNCNLDDLADKLGDATASRITAMCEVVEVKGRDRRQGI